MTDAQHLTDPFSKLTELGTDQKLFAQPSLPVQPDATESTATPTRKPTQKVTRTITQSRDRSSESPRDKPRKPARVIPSALPSRDEIQEFSFRLRDELKVKVQAEVPAGWQDELDDIARDLNVRKLELYRFILGEFLGKIQRQ